MPEGAPPPDGSALPTMFPPGTGPKAAATSNVDAEGVPVDVLPSLLAVFGSSQSDNRIHKSYGPGAKVSDTVRPRFPAERIVVENLTLGRVWIGSGAVPSPAVDGYDYLVPPMSVLSVKVNCQGVTGVLSEAPGTIDVYLLAGPAAVQGPAFEITQLRAGISASSFDAETVTTGAVQALAFGVPDPFNSTTLFVLRRLIVSMNNPGASAAGQCDLRLPSPAASFPPFLDVFLVSPPPGGIVNLDLDMGDLLIGAPATPNPTQIKCPTGLTVNTTFLVSQLA